MYQINFKALNIGVNLVFLKLLVFKNIVKVTTVKFLLLLSIYSIN